MQSAHIFQINVSKGGVPKLAIPQGEITPLGIVGDAQRNLKVHGGPMRALCLYALERILALQEEGHPVFPGAAGENLVIAGLDWDTVVPGVVLTLGDQVEIEVTQYTQPCLKIASAFINGDSLRIAQNQHPGWSRVYAKVLQTGHISVGNKVEIKTS